MKLRKAVLSLLLTAALVLGLGVPALAADRHVTALLYFRGIRLVVNGSTVTPTDAAGKVVEPFIIDGTTYLPVRAVAGALGLEVGWDDASSTVTLTRGAPVSGTLKEEDTPTSWTLASRDAQLTYRGIRLVVDGQAVTPTDAEGKTVEPFIIDGTTYLPVRAVANALGLEVGWDGPTSTVTLRAPAEYLLARESITVTEAGKTSSTDYAHSYDEAGRLVRTELHSSLLGDCVRTYTYNAAGLCTRFTDSQDGSVTTYSYDDAGRITREYTTREDGSSEELRYTYDAAGRELSNLSICTDSTGSSSSSGTSQYDARGNLIRYVAVDRSGTTFTDQYAYDARGNCTRHVFSNGSYTATTLSTYDDADRLLTWQCSDSDGEVSSSVYTYDDAGNLTYERSETTGADGAQQSSNTTYTYDDAGNCIQEVSGLGLPSKATTTRSFDARGNLLSEVYTAQAYTRRSDYSYDAQDRLLSCVCTYGNGQLDTQSYIYDAAGNVLVYDALDSDGYHVHYVYEYIEK